MSDLVGNPKYRFSHDEAHMVLVTYYPNDPSYTIVLKDAQKLVFKTYSMLNSCLLKLK